MDPAGAGGRSRVRCGPLTLDLARREAIASGTSVPLTPLEFALLRALVEFPGRVFSRGELLGRLHALDGKTPTDRALDSLVVRLRRKLRDDPRRPRMIQAVWGVGYRLAGPPAEPGVELASQAVDLVPMPALLLNSRRQIVAANPAAQRLLGRPVLGRPCFEILRCRAGSRELRDRCRWLQLGGTEPSACVYSVDLPAGATSVRATYLPLASGRSTMCLLVLTPATTAAPARA